MKAIMIVLTVFVSVLAVLIIVMRTGAVIHPANPLDAAGFATCDGRPCFFGITPGITAWSDARDILRSRWQGTIIERERSGTRRLIIDYGDGGTLLWIESDRREQQVRSIIWVVQDSTCCPALANVLTIYDRLCGDWRSQMRLRGSTQLRYMSANTRRSAETRKPSFYTKVYSIELSPYLPPLCQ